MKQQEKEKMRAKSEEELQPELAKREKSLLEAKFELGQGQLENVHLPNKLRKEIAVIKTIMTEKTMSSLEGGKEKDNE